MKTKYIYRNSIALLFIAACISLASCGGGADKSQDESNNIDNQQFKDSIGVWQAEGPLSAGGYSHGKYSSKMDLTEDGSCEMIFEINTNKTFMSSKGKTIVTLKGNWKISDENVHTDLKIQDWTFYRSDSEHRRIEEVDDFVKTYVFRRVDDSLVHGEDFDDNLSLQTTKDAGTTLMAEGIQIRLASPKYSKAQ